MWSGHRKSRSRLRCLKASLCSWAHFVLNIPESWHLSGSSTDMTVKFHWWSGQWSRSSEPQPGPPGGPIWPTPWGVNWESMCGSHPMVIWKLWHLSSERSVPRKTVQQTQISSLRFHSSQQNVTMKKHIPIYLLRPSRQICLDLLKSNGRPGCIWQ